MVIERKRLKNYHLYISVGAMIAGFVFLIIGTILFVKHPGIWDLWKEAMRGHWWAYAGGFIMYTIGYTWFKIIKDRV